MTRVPANSTDALRHAGTLGSDNRRVSLNPSTETGFYKTLLTTAPLGQLAKNVASEWSFQHLPPTEWTQDSASRSEDWSTEASNESTASDRQPIDEEDPSPTPRPTAESTTAPTPRRPLAVPQRHEPAMAFVGKPVSETGRQRATAAVSPSATAAVRQPTSDRVPTVVERTPAIVTKDVVPTAVRVAANDELPAELELAPESTEEPDEPTLVVWPTRTDRPSPPTLPTAEPRETPVELFHEKVTSRLNLPPDKSTVTSRRAAVRSEGFPTADEVVRRILTQSAVPSTSKSEAVSPSTAPEGAVTLDPDVWKLVPTSDVSAAVAPRLIRLGREGSSPDPRPAAAGSPSVTKTTSQELESSSPLEATETVEISFKSDGPIQQKSDRPIVRNNRRSTVREDQRDSSIGQRVGVSEGSAGAYARDDRPINHRISRELPPHYSLSELPVLPNGQRLVVESTLVGTKSAGVANHDFLSPIELELPGQLDTPPILGAASSGNATPAIAGSPFPLVTPSETAVPVDIENPDETGELRAVPLRVLNQVGQALREVPAGDSTIRLQLNPFELGQLVIEITFRDGVMHGKLRAEQGPTLKMLQDGLEGLRTRLSEQGIVVQTLDVELGQQSDFSQQQRSFSQSQEFGQQRQSSGYFSGDAPAGRRKTPAVEPPVSSRNKIADGRWAVDVIV
jgi:flagellar hook-length control protein FliK